MWADVDHLGLAGDWDYWVELFACKAKAIGTMDPIALPQTVVTTDSKCLQVSARHTAAGASRLRTMLERVSLLRSKSSFAFGFGSGEGVLEAEVSMLLVVLSSHGILVVKGHRKGAFLWARVKETVRCHGVVQSEPRRAEDMKEVHEMSCPQMVGVASKT